MSKANFTHYSFLYSFTWNGSFRNIWKGLWHELQLLIERRICHWTEGRICYRTAEINCLQVAESLQSSCRKQYLLWKYRMKLPSSGTKFAIIAQNIESTMEVQKKKLPSIGRKFAIIGQKMKFLRKFFFCNWLQFFLPVAVFPPNECHFSASWCFVLQSGSALIFAKIIFF